MFVFSSIINYVLHTICYLYLSFLVWLFGTLAKFAVNIRQSTSHGTCIKASKVRKHEFKAGGIIAHVEHTSNSCENGSAIIRDAKPTLTMTSEDGSGSSSEHTLVGSSKNGSGSERTLTGSSEDESVKIRNSEHTPSRSSEDESSMIQGSVRSSEDESSAIQSSENNLSRNSEEGSVTSRDLEHSLNEGSEDGFVHVRYPEPGQFDSINEETILHYLKPKKNIDDENVIESVINQKRDKFCNFDEPFCNLAEEIFNPSARIDFIFSKYNDAGREKIMKQSATIKEFFDFVCRDNSVESLYECSDDIEKEISGDAMKVFDESTNLKSDIEIETQPEFSNIVPKIEDTNELDIFHSWDRRKFYRFYLSGLVIFCILVYITDFFFHIENDMSQNPILKMSYLSMPLIIGVYLLHYQIVYGLTQFP